MISSPGWHFPVDQVDEWEGFNDSGIETFSGEPIRHLAREVIQNSIDARQPDSKLPVVVRFELSGRELDDIPDVGELRAAFIACLEASQSESPKAKKFFERSVSLLSGDKLQCLEITDSNTTGVKGPCVKGTFYHTFMKAKGTSRKAQGTTAVGSFGIGKFAPFANSALRTVFVSTVYLDDQGIVEQLTQGKSILMSHYVDNSQRHATGYWGHPDKCLPVSGATKTLAPWLQKATDVDSLSESIGTKLVILGFEPTKHWKEQLAATIAESFFGAIWDDALVVQIAGGPTLEKNNIAQFLENNGIKELIADLPDEPSRFEMAQAYLKALTDDPEVLTISGQLNHLGYCELRLLVREGLPKHVCALRSGIFITDDLPGLKRLGDFKDFVAVIQCKNKAGNSMLRDMEPPSHDKFEPGRLSTEDEIKKGKKALDELGRWVRDVLKRHAREEVTDITSLDELSDLFGEEDLSAGENGTTEADPFGKASIQLKPYKRRTPPAPIVILDMDDKEDASLGNVPGSDEEGEGVWPNRGEDKTKPSGRPPSPGDGDSDVNQSTASTRTAKLADLRLIANTSKSRRIAFTPTTTGNIKLSAVAAGADTDYTLPIETCDSGPVRDGAVVLSVTAGQRVIVELGFSPPFDGAIKVTAYEI